MKKTIGIVILTISLVHALPAFADINVSIKDAKNNIVVISDDTAATGNATILVLNPGKTTADITDGNYSANSEAVQHFNSVYCINEAATFEIQMNTQMGGLFNVLMKNPEETQTDTFEFYPADIKENIISIINRASNGAALLTKYEDISEETKLERVMRIYSLNNFSLYADGNKSKIADALISIRESVSGKTFTNDVNLMYSYLKQACILAAYNNSDTALICENGSLIYRDLLNLEGTPEMEDYDTSLSAEGRELLNQRLMGKSFKTLAQLQNCLKEEILYFVIKHYKQMGYGHLDHFFARYNSEYIANGFFLNSLSSNSDRKNQIYSTFMSKSASDTSQLAAVFNSSLSAGTTVNNSNPAGGGGGGGGSSSGNVNSSIMPPAVAEQPNGSSSAITGRFDDIDSVAWAKEAITYLADSGAINGKSDRIFAPNDFVKRAEFVKILIAAFKIETEGTVCHFEDVYNDWSYKYIAAASTNGIINGMSDKIFGVNEAISREQGAAILYRTAENQGISLSLTTEEKFADDADISEYAKNAVYKLKANDIISGRGSNMFVPKDSMTRAEAAKLIYQLLILR
ncbi:MAG: S-layer homology domain-containing protein [Clostridia bacterium]|nr:S-layer homology domain-containing protein [Clostridia bacterium]